MERGEQEWFKVRIRIAGVPLVNAKAPLGGNDRR